MKTNKKQKKKNLFGLESQLHMRAAIWFVKRLKL